MRGKPVGGLNLKTCSGITPADAGKTQEFFSGFGLTAGSPPRMRGKLAFARAQASQDGITPADAGKTAFHL